MPHTSSITSAFLKLFLLANLATSASIPLTPRAAVSANAAVLAIAPTSNTCAGATSECRTADQAGPFLIQAFQDYGIYTYPEMAAVLSLIAFESVDFKYDTNQQGTAGQGTRNMQMGNYNLQYAQYIATINATFASQLGATSTSDLNAVRALVLPDQYSFASGAWFLAKICTPAVRTAVQTQGYAGYNIYITQCVGTTMTSARQAYWTRAANMFGLDSSTS
jgi:hypothetical protein